MASLVKEKNDILSLYSADAEIMDMLLNCVEIEKQLADGMVVNSGFVTLKASINNETGLWEAFYELDHGRVEYTAFDQEAYTIEIKTIPSIKYIKDGEEMTDAQLQAIQEEHTRAFVIDLKDINSLKQAKEFFNDDYVLRNLPLNNVGGDSAARFVVWHIRAYRKYFADYYKQAHVLWEGTVFKNATSMLIAMKERALV